VTRITQVTAPSTDTLPMDKQNTRSNHDAHRGITETARLRMTPAQLEALARAEAERLEVLKRLGA